MLWRNTSLRYGHISILLHWIAALAIYGMFALGLWMVTLGYYDIWYHRAPEIHKAVGMLLFAIIIFRVVWRFISPPPAPLESYSTLTRVSSTLAHIALYVVLFGILISGYLISTAEGHPISVFGWFSIPATISGLTDQADIAGDVHLYLAWAVVALSALHAFAALKHHFIDGDNTLKRMLGRNVP
ncbi:MULTISPECIES: cytochrome b [Pectobacterium]|uniref:Cytochrome b n=1 Tax=Pectobacterium punjabense TaxID=2108399 RepID=A0ABX6L3D2_9GAMM|nr:MULTISPECIES: cytochrome b [Pectobacterium]GKW10520.1 cytochrome b [Pectobacterium carotovorum subsp. carotovorum]MBS4431632.1 cytochrome b [Pectobacterium punjabense]MCE9730396.1 cytochrome b [Pectobacterium sp. IFB5596]MDG0795920.1 cytochrome b [Pectobacterium punjabense]PTA66194.1 cytochrome b [Pectobacterium punjabense]